MTFSKALEAVIQGKRATRTGWNGKDQHIELVKEIMVRTSSGTIYNKSIIFKGNGFHIGWTPTQEDMLSNDWMVLIDENNWNSDNYIRGRIHEGA